MKKIVSLILALTLLAAALFAFTSCGTQKSHKIAIPNDTTNEARALKLLEAQGIITLRSGLDTTATIRDIESNPYKIEFVEAAAETLPRILKDVGYAIINSNYAIDAGITPFVTEGTDVSYPNIIAVKDGNQTTDKTKALVAAVNSQAVKDYINNTYKGAIVCDLTSVGDGFDSTVDYDALAGTTIKIAASPTPHSDILEVAKTLLATKNITLQINEFNDYVVPNQVVESGEYDANYFQHIPYLNDFNEKNNTHIVSVLEVHHEPMGIYSDTYTSLDELKK